MHVPPGYALFIPSAIRKAVDLPVVGVGRFKDPLQAERALAEGHCDLVGVVRGQIADADFAAKARAGATDDDPPVPVVQPGVRRPDGPQPLARLHREPAHRPGGRAASACAGPWRRRRSGVLVVGAGPAGLQAAIAAARNGHRRDGVRAASRRPGGQVRLAASVPNRAELGDLVRNQLTECRRARRHHRVRRRRRGRAWWPSARPDHVIVATGAEPARPWWVPPTQAERVSTSATCSTARPQPVRSTSW